MPKARADLGFAEALDNFDPNEWARRPSKPPEKDAVKSAAKAAGFSSREEKPATPQRRRRTGRNAQINLKAKPETIHEFTTIADEKGWGLGETFEYAVKLLKRECDIMKRDCEGQARDIKDFDRVLSEEALKALSSRRKRG